MTKIEFLLMVMRSALWQTPMRQFKFPADKYTSIMKTADKQCVMGLIADGMQRSNTGLEKDSLYHLLKLKQKLAEENSKVNANLHELCSLLDEAQIPFMVVKGQVVGALYPNPALRMAGDIDFYISKDHFDRAIRLISDRWGEEMDDHNDRHIELQHNGTVMEAHRYLLRFPSKRMREHFDRLVDAYPPEMVAVDGREVPTLMPTLNVLYTFLHLFNHFIQIGVALRQLCDLAVLLHQRRASIDRALLSQWLDDFDIANGFRVFGAILIDKMGLPAEDFPYPITDIDRKRSERAFHLIVRHGNWGAYRRKNHDGRSLAFMMERARIRMSNHLLFYRLAPRYNRALLFNALPQKVWNTIRR